MITPLLKQRTYFNEIRTGTDNVRLSNNPRHFMLQKRNRREAFHLGDPFYFDSSDRHSTRLVACGRMPVRARDKQFVFSSRELRQPILNMGAVNGLPRRLGFFSRYFPCQLRNRLTEYGRFFAPGPG